METEIPDPIQDCQDRFEAMRHGMRDGVTPAEAASGRNAAEAWRRNEDGLTPRRLGSGVIKSLGLGAFGEDRLPVWVAVTDDERVGAVLVTLSGSAVAVAELRGDDPADYVLDRLRHMSIPNEYSHFDQIALAHPLHF